MVDKIQLNYFGKKRIGHFHPFGGGFVEETAHVDLFTYVGPMVKVLDKANVTGLLTVLDGQAVVMNEANITNGAKVLEHSIVKDRAQVLNGATVKGYSVISEHAIVFGGETILDNAHIRGRSTEGFSLEQQSTFKYYDSRPRIEIIGSVDYGKPGPIDLSP